MIHRNTFNLAHAYMEARHKRIPMCPLHPDYRLELDGVAYSFERLGYSGISNTERIAVAVISEETGIRMDYDVIRAFRQSKRTGRTTIHINRLGAPKSTKGWKGWEEAYMGLAELAAPYLRALPVSNPVTGPVNIPFRYGGWTGGAA